MTSPESGLDFLVDKNDWKRTRFQESPAPEPGPGQVLFRVDRFAFTANNISYALVGDSLGYWRFFPAEAPWGRLPVMGFGDVIASRCEGVAEGTRCFGFYPMSRHLVIQPGATGPAQIVDAAPHREGLAPAYAQYSPVEHDALYSAEHEDLMMLLRGLFLTGYLAADLFDERDHFGAGSVLISSASSKTAIALAHCVAGAGRARTVGLTSARNLDFVRKLGCYDQVLRYDELTQLDPAAPALYVDLAGDAALRRAVHGHYGDALRHSCGIGATHWEAGGFEPETEPLPGPAPEFFFAPAQIQKRVGDWGPAGFQQRLAQAWTGFRDFAAGWLSVERGAGPEAVQRVYDDTLAGRVPPDRGQVLSLG